MDDVDHDHAKPRASDPIVSTGLPALGLSALGVVFGDIGTSPLYTLKTVLTLIGGAPAPDHVLGVLSLILWTLVIITTIKYVTVAMSIDNDGEGGVLALMALLGVKRHQRPAIVAVGLFGAALIYGDGGVFLCVTGAEALYADMGHFGSRPIRLAWSGIVFPSLVLNYAGQAALVLEGAPISENIFYRLCPEPLLIPMVALATVATVVASQSIITGAFSMTRQAIQLGWLPRLRITQTSEQGYGQIYVGVVNWLLMAVTIGLTISFGKSDNLAAAYGIAVSATMLMTSALLFIAMREVWGWSLPLAAAAAGAFICVDSAFFVANFDKVLEGGYVPLLLAAGVYGIMLIWHRGSLAVAQAFSARLVPIDEFMASLEAQKIPRVPGTAVFLTRTVRDTPPVMVWHVKQNRALHEHVLALRVLVDSVPWIPDSERLSVTMIAPNVWRATAHYGFMERPDIPALLAEARDHGCAVDLDDVTYYVGHETVVRREDGKGLPAWEEKLFAVMERNAVHVTGFFRLPLDKVVELGRHVAI